MTLIKVFVSYFISNTNIRPVHRKYTNLSNRASTNTNTFVPFFKLSISCIELVFQNVDTTTTTEAQKLQTLREEMAIKLVTKATQNTPTSPKY